MLVILLAIVVLNLVSYQYLRQVVQYRPLGQCNLFGDKNQREIIANDLATYLIKRASCRHE